MKQCQICQSTDHVVELWGYTENEEFKICKSCLRKALKVEDDGILNFGAKIVNPSHHIEPD